MPARPYEYGEPYDRSKEFRPANEPQDFFLSLPDNIFEALCGGEAGGGKSDALLAYPIVKGWFKHPQFKGIIFRESFPALDKSLIPRAQELYGINGKDKLGAKWNGQEHCFDFASIGGGKIWLSYIENKNDAMKHDTNEYNYVAWDELTHFDWEVYSYLLHRCRTSVSGLPAVIRAGATPGGKGNFWVYERFIKPYPEGRKTLVETLPSGRRLTRTFVKIKTSDNKYLLRENPNYVAQIEMLGGAESRAKQGDWLAFLGQVFTEFRARRFDGEPENALHVVEPFEIPAWWPRGFALDWGFDANTYGAWGAVSPNGRLYVYREYSARFTYISQWAADIKNLSKGENLRFRVIDPSAAKRLGYEKTIKQQVIEQTGMDFEDADNDRIGGKMLLHELLRWKPKPVTHNPVAGYDYETELRILRINGPEAVDDYRRSFLPEPPETNLPKLQIFSSCPMLIETIQLCSYDEKKTEDVKEFKGDDPYDDIRYLAKAYHRYITESLEESKRFQKVSAAHAALESTGDYGSFMRKMAGLEAEENQAGISVRRLRGFGRRTLGIERVH